MKDATDEEVIRDAWTLAEEELKKLPPYLADDEMTVERFYEAHKDVLGSIEETRLFLDALAESGRMEKQQRRQKGKGGARPIAYVMKG